MAKAKELAPEALAQLGAPRLAEILLLASEDDKLLRRKLDLEVLGHQDPNELAKRIRRRIATIKRSKSQVYWEKIRDLRTDLDLHLEFIASSIVPANPELAVDLLWSFLNISNPVLDRIVGSDDTVLFSFRDAVQVLGKVIAAGTTNTDAAVKNVLQCLAENDYGQFDQLVKNIAPSLGEEGQNRLKKSLHDQLHDQETKGADLDRVINKNLIKSALMTLADIQEDVDAYIALIDEDRRTNPNYATAIARRLLQAKRTAEALDFLNSAEENHPTGAWFDTYIEVNDELGRQDVAQASRWKCFATNLSPEHLRDFLKRLDDVEAFDAEEKALDLAANYQHSRKALQFLIDWPDLRRAANLVLNRIDEFDGFYYQSVGSAADALAGRDDLASTLLLRSMIDYALDNKSTKRYRHIARHLNECGQLAMQITDYGSFLSHEAYVDQLKVRHGRKDSFWRHVS